LLELEDEPLKKGKKKREATTMRKDPRAPKRFKSSYICFFMEKQPVIKEELGDQASVTAISKRSAEMWKCLPSEERAVWDEIALKDKQRYMLEKAQYSGPWQVPWKRVRKDPSAPKRPMSAFLYFSQGQRSHIKKSNPELKNTEVSSILGEMWRNLTDEERAPHVDREWQEREKYKIAIATWREENGAKLEAERKVHVEQAELAAIMPDTKPQMFPDPFAPQPTPLANPYAFPGYPLRTLPMHVSLIELFDKRANSQFPFLLTAYQAPGQFQFPTNGKQPVILGPSGTPYLNQPGMAVLMTPQPSMQVPPPMFDDGTGLMPLTNNSKYGYSGDQGGGDGGV
jgi:HMG (high mobility group) box